MRYGVDYRGLDKFKREMQSAAGGTDPNIADLGFSVVEESRGESVFLVDEGDRFTAHVVEGLGTANRVAEWVLRRTGQSFFANVAQSGAAMILNDLGVCGARPVVLLMYVAVGKETYFSSPEVRKGIAAGWMNACNLAKCSWGGGETPKLRGIVMPDTMDLGGSSYGVLSPKDRLIPGTVQAGDVIIFARATGPHANGYTLIRDINSHLRNGYLTKIDGDLTFGEAVMAATPIYVQLIQRCLDAGIVLHRVENITGHGWRKVMRGEGDFTYVIERMPEQLPVFDFIKACGRQTNRQMFSTFNMGAGMCFIAPPESADVMMREFGDEWGLTRGGHVEEGAKRVVIRPMRGLTFKGKSLQVR